MSHNNKISGRCYCGAVQYEIKHEPVHVDVCHCENCRRVTGGQAVAWAIFPKAHFRYTRGQPGTYKSETQAIWSFCSTCGTTLNYQSQQRPQELDVVLVTLDDPKKYPPRGNSNIKEKLPWVNLVSQSQRHVNLSGADFDDVNLSKARFHNVNLSDIEVSAAQLGGATFRHVGPPPDKDGRQARQRPVTFEKAMLCDSTFRRVDLSNVKIVECNIQGMTIDGVLVTDFIAVHKNQRK